MFNSSPSRFSYPNLHNLSVRGLGPAPCLQLERNSPVNVSPFPSHTQTQIPNRSLTHSQNASTPGCTNPGRKSPQCSSSGSSPPSYTTSWSTRTTDKPPTPSTPRTCSTTTRTSASPESAAPHAKQAIPNSAIRVWEPTTARAPAQASSPFRTPPRVCELAHGDRKRRTHAPSGASVPALPATTPRAAPQGPRNVHSPRVACSGVTVPRR